MAKLTIEITAPIAAFSNYADELGYQAKIVNPADPTSTDLLDNPKTKAEFFGDRIKEIVAKALADKSVNTIQRAKQMEVMTERQTLEGNIKNATEVTVTN